MMDEGLAAGWSPESGGQRLHVWMEIGVPQCWQRFEDDTKLCGAGNMPEGWDTIERDLSRLEL